jgi:CubicO group peptidase (beta-lactamase class C family)
MMSESDRARSVRTASFHQSHLGKACIVLLACFLPCLGAVASPGTSAARTVDWGEVDAIFKSIDNSDSPAASVAIVWEGEPVYVRSYGMANIEEGTKANADTAFPLASVTKQFTAYAVLKLAEQGKLSIDAPITTYLPELRYHDVSVRHLMNQIGGVPGASLSAYGNFSTSSTAGLLEMYKAQDGLVAKPGTRWSYQNSNYFLLDAIVQRVSEKSLAAYLHDEVFAPLGMTHSFFPFGPGWTRENRAFGYASRDGTYRNLDTIDVYTDLTGSGGMYASINDLLRWDRAFYASNPAAKWRREEGRYLSGRPVGYGAGLNVRHVDGVRSWEHGGTSGATSTYIAHYPDYGAAIIVLIASDRFRPQGEAAAFARQIRKMMFDRFLPNGIPKQQAQAAWKPWTRDQRASMAGRWFGELNGRMQSIDLSLLPDGELGVAMFDGFKAPLKQVGDSQFAVEGQQTVVLTLSGDEISAVDEGKTLASLRRIPQGSPRPIPQDIAGHYSAPALNGGVWTLAWQEDVLIATSPRGGSTPMPSFHDNIIGSNDSGLFMAFDGEPGVGAGLTLLAGQVPPIRMTRTDARPAITLLMQAIDDGGAEAAWSRYREMRASPARYAFSEAAMNALGYKLLQAQRAKEALAVFEMMVDAYPASLNALDSLADGQQANGMREAAMASYERILSLQPNQGNARQALQRLRDAAPVP